MSKYLPFITPLSVYCHMPAPVYWSSAFHWATQRSIWASLGLDSRPCIQDTLEYSPQ